MGKHRKPENRRGIGVTAACVAVIMLALTAPSAHAAVMTPGMRSNLALNWAESQKGHPYVWAGSGPWGYDCSGLVMAAFARQGITLPHNTVAMIESGKLIRVYHPRRGDLAFWGSTYYPSHVEFVTTWHHGTFGAQEPGTLVWWHRWNGYWAPSSFWRVVG